MNSLPSYCLQNNKIVHVYLTLSLLMMTQEAFVDSLNQNQDQTVENVQFDL